MQNTHSSTDKTDMIGDPVRLSKSGFAKKVGLTPGRISQLIKKGLPVEPNGKIDVAQGRVWLSENVNPVQAAAQKQGSLKLPEDLRQTNLTAQRTRLAKEQADAAEYKNAQLCGELVKATTVEREWSAVLRKVRSGVLAVPSRIRQQITHLTAHDMEIIDKELRTALESLSNDV